MRILVTGAGGRLARLTAAVLASRPGVSVTAAGLDPGAGLAAEAAPDLPRGPGLAATLRALAPDVVVHLDQPGEEVPGLRAGQLQAIDLIGACAAVGVPRLVLRSSSLVYGASPDTPALLRESAPLRPAPLPGLQTDYVAVERFAADLAARHPALAIVTLRMAGVVGGGVESPLAAYLRRPAPFVWPGLSPRIQALHADDAVVALALAALGQARGPLNIAPDPLPLGQAVRLAGRVPVPLPPLAFSGAALGQQLTGPVRATLPFDPAFLRFACVADSRRAAEELGWRPQRTSAEAIRELAAAP